MVTIEIDDDLYNQLKLLAEPFIDTPNTVIRKLISLAQNSTNKLTRSNSSTSYTIKQDQGLSSLSFMNSFLKNRYKEKFHVRSPYRTMFESENYLVYFQNFNKKDTNNLWYRLKNDSLKILRQSNKNALVCFTNPSEKIVFEIPVKDIDKKAAEVKWNRNFFEVNIDPANSRWRELDWKIESYLVSIQT
jgi:predicted transcriptional regulator